MASKVALMGAGGKMGCRITDNLLGNMDYEVAHIEISEQGVANLAQCGVTVVPQSEAIPAADIVVLAVPDKLIAAISAGVVPAMAPGSLLVTLDPAAPQAGVIPRREDVGQFVVHPCHPPLFGIETTPEQRTDWFGGAYAAQDLVCALMAGPDSDYGRGEALSREMFAPVAQVFRITVEQMAILEPAMVETISAVLVKGIVQAEEAAVEMGVPADAARSFLLGHLRVQMAVLFGMADFPFSDAANDALGQAYPLIYREGWLEGIMNLEAIQASVEGIAGSVSSGDT